MEGVFTPDCKSGSEPRKTALPSLNWVEALGPFSLDLLAHRLEPQNDNREIISLSRVFGNNLNPHHHFCILLRFLKSMDRELAKHWGGGEGGTMRKKISMEDNGWMQITWTCKTH